MLDDKHIKEEIAGNWDRASETYDDCYAHGIKSEAETREWLRLLDQLVEQETGMPVHVADSPLDCVVDGTGKRLEVTMPSSYYKARR